MPRHVLKTLLIASVAAACNKEGRSLVPIDVELAAQAPMMPASVRVIVSSRTSGDSWPAEHGWSGQVVQFGIYVPADVRGDVTTTACGFDSYGNAIAFGTGNIVSVTPGHEAALVTVKLDGAGPGSAGCAIGAAGGMGGTGGTAGTGRAGGSGGMAGTGGTAGSGGTSAAGGTGGVFDAGGTGGLFDAGDAGYVAVTWADRPAEVNLTSLGTIDWADWSAQEQPRFNHKKDVNKISDVTPAPPANTVTYGPSFSWTDGMPMQASATGEGVYRNYAGTYSPVLSWTVPAATTMQTLRLYIGTDGVTKLTAELSDGSASYVFPTLDNNDRAIDVTFRASSPGTMLTIKWEFTSATPTVSTMFIYAAILF